MTESDLKIPQLNQPVDDNDAFNPLTVSEINRLTDTKFLPQPNPVPVLHAYMKHIPDDFHVNELVDIDFTNHGEHLWLKIKKTAMNTTFIAQQLAKWANISNRDVGYSGLKDRQAVTTQWFSLRLPKGQIPESSFEDFISSSSHSQKLEAFSTSASTESVDVLQQAWHSKKLNRGTHKANQFIIKLRHIHLNPDVVKDRQGVDDILRQISEQGVPNYFGNQRFGRQGNNIVTALEWFEQGRIKGRKPHPKKSRDTQSLLLSSARSAIFNQILAKRVCENSWNKGLDGDVFNLDGSGSVFSSDTIDETIRSRLNAGDIHPTGPLWGINNDKVAGSAKVLENEVIDTHPILKRLTVGLHHKQVKTMRRSLRLTITDMQWSWLDDNTLVLHFTLPAGTFATSVMASIVKDL